MLAQEGHLRLVVLECTKFGYLLFSQPAEFRLTFEVLGGMRGPCGPRGRDLNELELNKLVAEVVEGGDAGDGIVSI